ncbi:MAG: hypothetical protein DCF20_05935 [Pseudanabaena sp.]|nr:MAG: hypothetical protein DCF20_05935 [Pseudanabaena sp.]
MNGRSLFDLRFRRSGFVGCEWRLLFNGEIGDRVCGGEERSLFDGEIGDRVLWVLRAIAG